MKIISSKIIEKMTVLAISVLFPISFVQADGYLTKQQGFIQSPYAFHALGASINSRETSPKQTALTWLLDNSAIEDGVYTLQFTQSKQSRDGKKLGNLWGGLDLKFKFELLPQEYYLTTFPGLYGSHYTANDDTETGFRVNRSRVMFTIGSKWY